LTTDFPLDASAGGAPTLYVTDLGYDVFDPADLFDIAFLLCSPRHDLRGVFLTRQSGGGERVLDALAVRARQAVATFVGGGTLTAVLAEAPAPLNVVVVGGYTEVFAALVADRALFREKVARLFLVGGHANDYARGREGERLPIDPRLKERHPERFAPSGDPRAAGHQAEAFSALLTSGEGVIWLPRDICLWRYAAPGILSDGGAMAAFLLSELFYANLRAAGPDADRYDAADAPVLLSALPGLLLAVEPDPFAWMRLFRVIPARVEINASGAVGDLAATTDRPNLYAVIAIDSQALGKLLTATLRDRPLTV
jgi:hypothetical protein